MISFTVRISRFGTQGEKTGWTYIEIPADIVEKLKPGTRQSFRVKGRLDNFRIAGVAVMPMGGGRYIMPMNASLRKGTGKKLGAMLNVQIQVDKAPFKFNSDFLDCLADDPGATAFFQTLTASHQRYFSKWIDDAKTDETRTRRIAEAISALSKKWGYPEMLRARKTL